MHLVQKVVRTWKLSVVMGMRLNAFHLSLFIVSSVASQGVGEEKHSLPGCMGCCHSVCGFMPENSLHVCCGGRFYFS